MTIEEFLTQNNHKCAWLVRYTLAQGLRIFGTKRGIDIALKSIHIHLMSHEYLYVVLMHILCPMCLVDTTRKAKFEQICVMFHIKVAAEHSIL